MCLYNNYLPLILCTMNSVKIPEDCAKQWEILLLLLSSEEKKIDRTNETEIDTMKYFYNNEGVRKILLQWLNQMQQTYARKTSESDTALKCDDVSLLWRQRGNDRFRANAVEESYNCYSKSVIYAHQNRQMFPLALANRSAALLRLKKYKVCLSDISLALNAGYPVELRHKLLLRRADCYIELGQKMKARTALDDALEHAKTLQLTPSQIAEFERHIKTLEKKLDTVQLTVESDDVSLPDCHKGENPDFVCASSVLELRRNEAVGRHVVAREAVSRGDTLFSEAPYAWVALPGPQPVCDYCCGVDVNPVPCPGCSRAVYCSAECRDAARHHRWECGAARADLLPTIGIAHLALRVLLLTAENGFPEVPTDSKPSTAAELFHAYSQVDNVAIYNRNTPPFYRMFNLVTNFDKMNNTDYIQYSLTATLLTLYLEHFTSFFSFLPSRAPYELSGEQWRLFSGALVLRSMAQLVCNGHAALSLAVVDDSDQNRTISEREVRRATAIYPSAAMMNHSCDPNIINTFHKLRLVVVAGRELAAGGEVSNCYGPRRSREPPAARRAALRAQYLFHCLCDACTDKQQNNAQLFSAYLCQSCKGPVAAGRGRCQQCRSPVDLQRALDALDRADDLIAQAERCSSVEARCEKTQQSLRLKQQVLHRHHGAVRAAADRLARTYADLGEFSKSVELIKQNIQSLEYQFGSFSVEVAHELRKLSDVMLERILHTPQHADYRDWCLETHKILKKAVQLTELNYGSWEPLARRLRRQEALVAALLADSRGPDTDSVHHTLHYNLKI